MQTASVKDMIKALVSNSQAMTVVVAIVMINTALYITQTLVYFFLKYDFSPANYANDFTLFNIVGGGFQILSMMIFFPLLRKVMDTLKIFYTCFFMAVIGYAMILIESVAGANDIRLLLIPAAIIMSAVGMLNVIITIFLANTVDFGEWKNRRRDESVIFSMQTFVVKLASGFAAFISNMILAIFAISSDKDAVVVEPISDVARMGLRGSMTIIPMIVLCIGFIVFKKKYILTDAKLEEITADLHKRKEAATK